MVVKKFGSEKSSVVKNFGSEKNGSEKFGGEKFGSQIHHTIFLIGMTSLFSLTTQVYACHIGLI